MNYKEQYESQKRMAKHREIEWHFTYESWLEWWGEDITMRGRDKHDLVMARYGDIGPYHIDNVKKITRLENTLEAWEDKPAWNKGKTYSVGPQPNISIALKGNQYGKGNLGKVQDEAWKRKRLDKIKGPHEKIECPHCGKIGGERIMKRWHLENCKFNLTK